MLLSQKLKRLERRLFLPGTPPEYTKEAEALEAECDRLRGIIEKIGCRTLHEAHEPCQICALVDEAMAPYEQAAATPTGGLKYLAMIAGGLGPDVWDRELVIDAADFRDASEQAMAQAEACGGQVTSLEQSE